MVSDGASLEMAGAPWINSKADVPWLEVSARTIIKMIGHTTNKTLSNLANLAMSGARKYHA